MIKVIFDVRANLESLRSTNEEIYFYPEIQIKPNKYYDELYSFISSHDNVLIVTSSCIIFECVEIIKLQLKIDDFYIKLYDDDYKKHNEFDVCEIYDSFADVLQEYSNMEFEIIEKTREERITKEIENSSDISDETKEYIMANLVF